jgi:hypothetical protein
LLPARFINRGHSILTGVASPDILIFGMFRLAGGERDRYKAGEFRIARRTIESDHDGFVIYCRIHNGSIRKVPKKLTGQC